MKRKINRSLLLISILGILLTALLGTVMFYRFFVSQVQADLSAGAHILSDSGMFSRKDDISSIHIDPDYVRATWIDEDGTVLYDNVSNPAAMANHALRPEVKDAFESGQGTAVRESDTLGKSTFYYALLLPDGTVLRVSKIRANLLSLFRTTVPGLLIITALTVLLSVLLAHFLTRSLIAPIETMAEKIGSSSMNPPYPELIPFANKIRAQHEDILKSAKMRQDFTANVSHELKTPLTAISGYAELMETGMVDGSETKRFSAEIHANANRLLSLINDTIQLSQLDSYEENQPLEKVDLGKVAEKCVSGLQVSAERHRISLTYEGESCYVRGREEMLSELVMNLADNAIRYNYPNGYVKVSVHKTDGQAVLTVKDNGIGIPKEHQDRVFERFYRVDKSRSKQTGGTGLGLALVKHIVLLHGASLTLDSAPGVGTTITVTF